MRKIRNLVIGGIENKIFNLILISIILISLAFVAVSSYQRSLLSELTTETNERQQESISEITGSVMKQVVEKSMDRSTELEAAIANELFHGLANRVEMLGDYAQTLFTDPDSVTPMPYSGPDASKDGQVTAQLMLAEGVNEDKLSPRIGIAANMSDMMVSLFGASEVTNSCFIALPEGAFLVVDDRSASKFDEDGSITEYDPRTRPWYRLAVEKGGLAFTDVEVDAFTGDIGIVCSMPIYVDGKLEAVVGSDLFLSSMRDAVQASEGEGGFQFVVNQNGHVVFSPKTEGLFRVLPSSEAVDLRKTDDSELGALISDAMQNKTDVRLISLEDGVYYMIGAPVKTVGWALIAGFSQEAAGQPVAMLQDNYKQIGDEAVESYLAGTEKSKLTITVLFLAVLTVMGGTALALGKKIVQPLNTIVKRISSLSGQNLEFKMEDSYRTGDEIEVLAESFSTLSHRTVEYVEQIRQVTAEKERVATELHMANQIQESMLPSIFPAFPDRPEFDIYATMEPAKEVGGDFYDFFLIDHDHLCMVMADVSGKGIPAALFMMISKIIVQSCAMLGRSAAEILAKTNEALCSNNRMEMFVTAWLGILEIPTGKLTAANAGHEYPAVKCPEGSFELFRDKHGFVIGGLDSVSYKEYELQLEPGAKLFLYTDGLTEATDTNGGMFGTSRMLTALNADPDSTPEQVLTNMHHAVDDFVKDAEQFDDLTMLCMEYKGPVK